MSGLPDPPENVPSVILSHIVFERGEAADPGELTELRLDSLHSLRTGVPFSGQSRVTPSDMHGELAGLPAGTLLLDLTGRGRELLMLRRIAEQYSSLSFAFSTSPVLFLEGQDDPHRVAGLMRAELEAGVLFQGRYWKASSMSLEITEQVLVSEEVTGLLSCAAVHRQGTLAPIVVELPLAPDPNWDLIQDILSILQSEGADLSRVILTSLAVPSRSVDKMTELMLRFGCSVSIDGFGVSAVTSPTSGESFPSDSDLALSIDLICQRELHSQLIVSTNVRSKLFLRKFGGPGYQWMDESVVPRLQKYPHAKYYLASLLCANAKSLLEWRQQEIVEARPPETLPCYICKKEFVSGDHFTKFNFVYCSSSCLNSHRKRNWKADS